MALKTSRAVSQLFLYLLTLACGFGAGHSLAHGSGESYAVQVGAYRTLDETALSELRKSLSAHGVVQIEPAGEYQRVLVGDLQARQSAEALRQRLHDAGYTGAFVQKQRSGHQHQGEHGQRDYSVLQKLSPEQRANAVYLDGVLHLKQGDTFTPIEIE